MSIDLKDDGLWSVQGARFQRMNPDGTLAKPSRTLGGIGPFDLSDLVANTGDIILQVDTDTVYTISVDFSAAVDQAAVTVAEVVTAFNAAQVAEPFLASTDVSTGRLKIASSGSNETYMQVYGELAGYLEIGGVKTGSTLGTKWKSYFDAVTGISRAKNIKEGEEIESEAGDGSLYTVRTATILKGENITYNMIKDDKEFKELVMGGVYSSTNFTYEYPNTDDTKQPKFYMEAYVPKYAKGVQDRTDLKGYDQIIWRNCVGMEGDVSNEAKTWAVLAYNIVASELIDESSVKFSATAEAELSQEDVEALGIA